jgi:hypothetical protein
MSDQLAGKSRLDAALIGHHNIAVLSALPATGFFPAGASDVLFNRSTAAADEGLMLRRTGNHHAHGLPIPDSRFVQQQQIDGITAAMRMSMAPGMMPSAMPGQSSFPTTRIPHFPSIIAAPSSYNRRLDTVEVQLAAARMKEATSRLLWASMTPISPTYWPPAAALTPMQRILPRAIDVFSLSDASSPPDHHYISRSMSTIPGAASLLSTSEAASRMSPLLLTQHGPENFPMILQRVLANLELIPGGTNIISFLPDGLSFVVKNQHLFSKEVLPIYFPKMKSFASFQRQLNLYDFKRVGGVGSDQGAYRHKSFLRDNPSLSSTMRRTKIKGTKRSERNQER